MPKAKTMACMMANVKTNLDGQRCCRLDWLWGHLQSAVTFVDHPDIEFLFACELTALFL
jgi:hypothetical protein